MNRVELLDKLTTIKPALSSSDWIPELAHFWFFGLSVMAYNDRIGMSIPCKTEFTGAVPGNILLGLLDNTRGDSKGNIELQQEKNELNLKAGKTNVKLAMMGIPDGLFKMPKPDPTAKCIGAMDKFISAVNGCMRSISDDTSRPDYQGITLIPEKQLSMFSTDSRTISCTWLDDPALKLKKRCILSTAFCTQMVELYKALGKKEKHHLEIHDGHSLFVTENAILYGKLIVPDAPLDFVRLMNDHFPADAIDHLSPVPSNLLMAMERAIIVLDDKMVECRTDVSIGEGRMQLVSKARGGKINADVTDNLAFSDKHPEVNTRFNPKLVRVGAQSFDSMMATDDSIIFCERSGKTVSSVYLVSTTS
jgi:hypothetical protein